MSNLSELYRALYELLAGVDGIVDEVQTRIYAGEAPEDSPLPFVLMTRLDKGSLRDLTGKSGVGMGNFVFEVAGADHEDVDRILTALEHALDGYVGVISTEGVDVNFEEMELDGIGQIAWQKDVTRWEGHAVIHISWEESTSG